MIPVARILLNYWPPAKRQVLKHGGRTTKMLIVVARFFWLGELPAARPPKPGISQRRHLRERAARSSKGAGHRAAVFVHGWSTFWRRHHQSLIQPVFQHTCNKKMGCRASIMVKDCGPSPNFKRSPMEMLLLTSTSADENKSFRGGNKVKRWQQRNGMWLVVSQISKSSLKWTYFASNFHRPRQQFTPHLDIVKGRETVLFRQVTLYCRKTCLGVWSPKLWRAHQYPATQLSN